MPAKFHYSLISLLLLTGCNSSNENDSSLLPITSLLPPTQPEASLKTLMPVTDAIQLERFLKNGLNWRFYQYSDDYSSIDEVTDDSGAQENSNGSSTYTQESGVDESDIIEFDGERLYIAHQKADSIDIRVVNSNSPTPSVTPLATQTIEQKRLDGIYTLKQEDRTILSVLSTSKDYKFDTSSWFSGWRFFNTSSQVNVYQVTPEGFDPVSTQITFDGNIIESRRIDNTLYIVSRFSPSIEVLDEADNENAQENYETELLNTPLEALLPQVQVNGVSTPLFNPEDCYIPQPESAESVEGYDSILTIIAIDLTTSTINNATCMSGLTRGIYVSSKNLYLFGSKENQTVIHQFSLANSVVDYVTSGQVSGYLGRGNPSFRVSEFDGHLRVITTEYGSLDDDAGDIHHSLNILKIDENTSSLPLVARLPNENQPTTIGKPNEDIYAVRFDGPRAYIVTFREIDPFYVLDLTQPESPTILGELEIPGFSTLLHPVNNRYVLGFGEELDTGSFRNLVKVELFDITDPTQPESIAKQLLGESNSYSEALYNHHALTIYSPDADTLRFILPYQTTNSFKESRFATFELSDINNKAELQQVGDVLIESGDSLTNYYASKRSIIHDDSVHFIKADVVWSALWETPDTLVGPQ
ncbi:MAG: beta-propeller domain-containing protein [Pseudomonadota bacterium]